MFQSILNDPTLADAKFKDFEVFDDLTALTHPGMTIARHMSSSVARTSEDDL